MRWGGVGIVRGGAQFDLKGTKNVAAHAGATTTLGEATHIDCLDNTYIGDGAHHSIVEVFCLHLDKVLLRAARDEYGSAFVFEGNYVKAFLLIVESNSHNTMAIFDSVFEHGLANGHYS